MRERETPSDREWEQPKPASRQVLPPHKHSPKLYSDVAAGRDKKKFTLSLRKKDKHTPEDIIRLLKTKVNPAEIKVGITSLKALRDGKVVIEAGSKHELDILGDKI